MDYTLRYLPIAKQNGIAPEDYLRCLFEKAPYAETEEDREKLLPWNVSGASAKIFADVVSGDLKVVTPYEFMLQILEPYAEFDKLVA